MDLPKAIENIELAYTDFGDAITDITTALDAVSHDANVQAALVKLGDAQAHIEKAIKEARAAVKAL